jgi:hypothetical protein
MGNKPAKSKAKMVKQTPPEKEYKKQLARIKRFIKSAEKRGYQFSQSVIPDRPKRITRASVRRLAKITPQELYKKSTFTNASGELVSGAEGRRIERSLAAKKGARTKKAKKTDTSGITKAGSPPSIIDSVLSAVEDLIARFPDGNEWPNWQYGLHERHKNVLQRMLDTQIMLFGRATVAIRLQNSTADIVDMAERIIYGDSKDEAFQADIGWFAQILKGDNLTAEEALDVQDLANEYDV